MNWYSGRLEISINAGWQVIKTYHNVSYDEAVRIMNTKHVGEDGMYFPSPIQLKGDDSENEI